MCRAKKYLSALRSIEPLPFRFRAPMLYRRVTEYSTVSLRISLFICDKRLTNSVLGSAMRTRKSENEKKSKLRLSCRVKRSSSNIVIPLKIYQRNHLPINWNKTGKRTAPIMHFPFVLKWANKSWVYFRTVLNFRCNTAQKI